MWAYQLTIPSNGKSKEKHLKLALRQASGKQTANLLYKINILAGKPNVLNNLDP